MNQPFSAVSAELVPDGSLRDFYIQEITATEWNKFLNFVSSLPENVSFHWGDQEIEVPQSFESIQELRKENPIILRILISQRGLNCHFFSDQEIELDFEPGDFNSERGWNELIRFLNRVVDAVGHKGIITHENTPEFVIQEIEPN